MLEQHGFSRSPAISPLCGDQAWSGRGGVHRELCLRASPESGSFPAGAQDEALVLLTDREVGRTPEVGGTPAALCPAGLQFLL